MFVLDNNVVREGWSDAKAVVTGTLEKHGGKVLNARRWDERRLAYPIAGKNRGTFLLAYYEMPTDGISAMRRDFDLSERVLRYLELGVDAIPEGEEELAAAEQSADFSVPEPPDDDARDESEGEESSPEARGTAGDEGAADGGEAKEGEAKADASAEAAPAESTDAPAETAESTDAPAETAESTDAPAETAESTDAPAETAESTDAPAETAEAPAAEAQPENKEEV